MGKKSDWKKKKRKTLTSCLHRQNILNLGKINLIRCQLKIEIRWNDVKTAGQSLISLVVVRCPCWSVASSCIPWFQERSPALFPSTAARLSNVVRVWVEKTGGHLLIFQCWLSLEVRKNPLSLRLSNFLYHWYHKRPLRDAHSSIPVLYIKINLSSLVGTNFLINGSLIVFFL